MTEFFCGFETGTASHDTYSGGVNISTTSPRYGNFCGQIAVTGTGTQSFQPGVPTSSVPFTSQVTINPPAAFSFAMRIDVRPASVSEEVFTIQGNQVRINSSGLLELWGGSPTTSLQQTGTTVLTTGLWYVVEMYMTSSAQTLRVYRDGHAPVADEFAFGAGSSTTVTFGKATDRNGQSITVSYDDIHLKDGVGGYLGDSKVLLQPGNPNSPIYDGFSKTPNTSINVVWNDTPSNPSTYASSTNTGADKQTMAHNPVWPGGSSVTINAMKTCTTGNNSGGPPIQSIRMVGPPGSIVETDDTLYLGAVTYWVTPWPTVPSLSDLNSCQIGVYRNAGGGSQTTIYECYLQVCFSNLVLPTGGTIQFVIM